MQTENEDRPLQVGPIPIFLHEQLPMEGFNLKRFNQNLQLEDFDYRDSGSDVDLSPEDDDRSRQTYMFGGTLLFDSFLKSSILKKNNITMDLNQLSTTLDPVAQALRQILTADLLSFRKREQKKFENSQFSLRENCTMLTGVYFKDEDPTAQLYRQSIEG